MSVSDGLMSDNDFKCEEISQADKEAMADFLQGTCYSIPAACEALGLPEHQDWDDMLLDVNTEICKRCDHWFEVPMLIWIESESGGVCDQCLEDHERDD